MKILLSFLLLIPSVVFADASLLAKLKDPGVIAIARHALAPGTGDPQVVDLNDRTTQRNLSKQGEDQARNMGAMIRNAGVETAAVFTSQWARCRETAQLMNLGDVTDLPALNSFFRNPERKATQMKELRAWLAEPPTDLPIVLITHQVVVTDITDIFPASGEIILIQQDEDQVWQVIGRVKTPLG